MIGSPILTFADTTRLYPEQISKMLKVSLAKVFTLTSGNIPACNMRDSWIHTSYLAGPNVGSPV